ncbi:hypothetical protein CXG81DRAFT_18724 [Caulochytrium protostelioides]|uniref:Uncharacterized protein n=1 Tax=Caulochytrium protostelioides TaxID=1555241 RepID=A0A4P9X895_9FUNG|nr:hypothetical protein CXG81DRAFT_18724 [Caulochytrium protostelioides]|eukprot:RKP01504.1 hypothetical protein CXG81DRAFT_18724 [Caulochytrium protostelioides]
MMGAVKRLLWLTRRTRRYVIESAKLFLAFPAPQRRQLILIPHAACTLGDIAVHLTPKAKDPLSLLFCVLCAFAALCAHFPRTAFHSGRRRHGHRLQVLHTCAHCWRRPLLVTLPAPGRCSYLVGRRSPLLKRLARARVLAAARRTPPDTVTPALAFPRPTAHDAMTKKLRTKLKTRTKQRPSAAPRPADTRATLAVSASAASSPSALPCSPTPSLPPSLPLSPSLSPFVTPSSSPVPSLSTDAGRSVHRGDADDDGTADLEGADRRADGLAEADAEVDAACNTDADAAANAGGMSHPALDVYAGAAPQRYTPQIMKPPAVDCIDCGLIDPPVFTVRGHRCRVALGPEAPVNVVTPGAVKHYGLRVHAAWVEKAFAFDLELLPSSMMGGQSLPHMRAYMKRGDRLLRCRPVGAVTLPLQLGDLAVPTTAYVVDLPAVDIYLGAQWMREYHATCTTTENRSSWKIRTPDRIVAVFDSRDALSWAPYLPFRISLKMHRLLNHDLPRPFALAEPDLDLDHADRVAAVATAAPVSPPAESVTSML